MNTAFWFSFTFTCGIFVGKVLPKLIEWMFYKLDEKVAKEQADREKNEESEDTE